MTTAPSVLNSIVAQVQEVDHDLDEYSPVEITQQQSLTVFEENRNTMPEKTSKTEVNTEVNTEELFERNQQLYNIPAEETPVEEIKMQEEPVEKLRPVEETKQIKPENAMAEIEQKTAEKANTKKRVYFTEAKDEVECKMIKKELQQYEEINILELENAQPIECNVSVHSDSETEEMFLGEPQRSKSFTMEVLVDCLMRTEELLINNRLEEVKANINFLLNKCQNRTSVRKRLVGKRSKKNLQGYVHVFCAKRAFGFYGNSYEKPKTIPQMVHFLTIKCADKNEETDKTSSSNVVRDLKKVAGKYLYRNNETPKKHMNVFKPKKKLEKCINLMYNYVQENNLTVVFDNSAWRTKLNELPDDVQSEASE